MDADQKDYTVKKKKAPSWARKIKGPFEYIQLADKTLLILGTAHVSRASVEDVDSAVDHFKPDIVAVELCPSRYEAMKNPDRWKKLDIVQVIKEKKVYLLMSSIILSAFQKKMGEENEIKPGQEMLEAVNLAEARMIALKLIDRDVQITLKRAWQNTGYFSKMMIVSELLSSLLSPSKISAEEVEKMKEMDLLEDLIEQIPGRFAKVKYILIDERDQYMASQIQEAIESHPDEERMLVVVGAGHLQGILKELEKKHTPGDLVHVKKKNPVFSFIKFFLPVILILVVIGFFTDTSRKDVVVKSIAAWAIIKATTVLVVAAALRGHIFSVLAAALTAPISTFQPFLKPGWVAALIEAKFHKPSVSDFENIAEDTKKLSGFIRNKVVRIFMLLILPQMASALGTILALWYIASNF